MCGGPFHEDGSLCGSKHAETCSGFLIFRCRRRLKLLKWTLYVPPSVSAKVICSDVILIQRIADFFLVICPLL